jgi:hypothetical protein
MSNDRNSRSLFQPIVELVEPVRLTGFCGTCCKATLFTGT